MSMQDCVFTADHKKERLVSRPLLSWFTKVFVCYRKKFIGNSFKN